MNHFTIDDTRRKEFEEVWLNRDRRLKEMKGFLSFKFLKGDANEGKRIYCSHTTWETEEDFIAWTESEQFKQVHNNIKTPPGIILGPPSFGGYEVILDN